MTINEMITALTALKDAGHGDREVSVLVEDMRREIIYEATRVQVECAEVLGAMPEGEPGILLVDF